MFLPIGDDHPRASTPWVTYLCLFVFVSATIVGMNSRDPFVDFFGISVYTASGGDFAHQLTTLLLALYLFIFFWMFADNVEDRLGHIGFGGFLISVGVASLILETVFSAHIENAVVVGIVTACSAAYGFWFPNHEIRVLHFYSHFTGGWFGRHEPGLRIASVHAKYVLLVAFLALAVLVSVFEALYAAPVIVGCAFGIGVAFLANSFLPDPEVHEQLHGGRFRDEPSRSPERKRGAVEAALPLGAVGTPENAARRGVLASTDDTVELDATEHGWAVVRATDDMVPVPTIGRLVAKTTQEPLFDVTRRIRGTRGVLAIGLDRNTAKRCAKVVSEGGIPCRALPWGPHLFPGSENAARVAWSDDQLAVETRDGELREYAWSRVRLATGYQLSRTKTARRRVSVGADEWTGALFESSGYDGPEESIVEQVIETTQTFIELYVEPPGIGRQWIRVRIPVERVEFVADGVANRDREFARFLESRPEIAKNPAISIIANGSGRWTYLKFKSRQLAALYLAWLLSLVGQAEGPAQESSPDVSSFLE